MTLEDSTTYRWIIEQGEAKGAHRLVLRLGAKRFGPPPAGTVAAVQAVTDRDRLDRIAERVLDAGGWDDLLATR